MFHDILRLASDNWYLVLGAIAAVILPLWLMYILRARSRRPVATLRDKVTAKFRHARGPDLDQMLNWLPEERGHERRRSSRRLGPPTPIRVAATSTVDLATTPTDEALVLDRAVGGLCFAVERPFRAEEGVFLWVEGSPDCPWVAVVVRHCRNCGSFFLVGCEFRDTLPLNIRLQFG